MPTAEHRRLAVSASRDADWKHWGPYLAERAWGTVREDYSPAGDAWSHFPHDQARSRAYRWNDDGLAGLCNRFQNLCLALAIWNGRDPFLKERLFGLAGPEGNHGEDVKEYYFYLDSTPTHSYMRMLYKYPQAEFPYARLVDENRRRGRDQTEFELADALADDWTEGRYFDVFVEFAKAGQEDLLCRIEAINRGPDPAEIHILPHLWARNTWSWGHDDRRPRLAADGPSTILADHRHLGPRHWYLDREPGDPDLLFTDNDTNTERLFGIPNASPFVKDAFHDHVVGRLPGRVNPDRVGTKAAAHYRAVVPPGGSFAVRWRFADRGLADPFADFAPTLDLRRHEADAFHVAIDPPGLTADERLVRRQAFAGLLWSKQFYHYSVELWLDGDPTGPPPPPNRKQGRNSGWRHAYHLDVLSMPDKWEYPWFAAWDLAFHCVPLAEVDPEWARRQLVLMLREWYMHPNGQLAAYEWDFGDVNPPVHAWAAWQVYQAARAAEGRPNLDFLEEVFHKLLLNFTWWVNRKDSAGRNAFQGGFLGMDNIGVFDRSKPDGIPAGGRLEQADGTAWMAFFCLNMLAIAIELAAHRPAYEGLATKFFEHFIAIAHALNGLDGEPGMWDPADRFFYDVIHAPGQPPHHLRIRSFVGLIPLCAAVAVAPEALERLPRFRRRVAWYMKYRPLLAGHARLLTEPGTGGHRLLSVLDRSQLESVLPRVLDPSQFLSDYGIRSLSKAHADAPYECHGRTVGYEPGESSSPIYGGNSNWRGPIWFPVNYILIESLRQYHRYFGDGFRAELPRGSGRPVPLDAVADDLADRLVRLFLRDPARDGRRPVLGGAELFQRDPHWRDYIPFYEYFHGDDGTGLGASHQTGWTALVASLLTRRRVPPCGSDGQPPRP